MQRGWCVPGDGQAIPPVCGYERHNGARSSKAGPRAMHSSSREDDIQQARRRHDDISVPTFKAHLPTALIPMPDWRAGNLDKSSACCTVRQDASAGFFRVRTSGHPDVCHTSISAHTGLSLTLGTFSTSLWNWRGSRRVCCAEITADACRRTRQGFSLICPFARRKRTAVKSNTWFAYLPVVATNLQA
jgi:hypothetical protein